MLSQLKVVFCGSPQFGAEILAHLHAAGANIVAVVTQPDKPRGRGLRLSPTPVKLQARALGLPIFTPRSWKKQPAFLARLKQLQPDFIVTAAYGVILPPQALSIPRLLPLNVHASLLPRWRGPAPVAAAILAGDCETGITFMRMREKMDAGEILAQYRLSITLRDTTETLLRRLTQLAANYLPLVLEKAARGELRLLPQNDSAATYCRLLRKEDGFINWERPAEEIERMIRAFQPWPRAYTFWKKTRIILLDAEVIEGHAFPGRVEVVEQKPAVGTSTSRLLWKRIVVSGYPPLPAERIWQLCPGLAHATLETKKKVVRFASPAA
jgi:methionyl-tRNA formyltransferase